MKKRMKCDMADSKMCDSYNLWIEAWNMANVNT